MEHLTVLLCAYDEEPALGPLFDRLAEALSGRSYDVLLVDDGSKDGTLEVARRYAARMPVTIVAHPRNIGLGGAMSTGLRNLVNLRRRPDVVATMDADNTHDPSQILTMVREIERGADVVICSRYASGASTVGVPGYRVLLSAGARFLFGVLVGASGVQDYTSGYRVYRMDVVDRLTREFRPLVRARGFAVQTEILAKAAALGSRFSEVAMQLRYDLKPGRSKLRLVPTLIEYVRVVTLTKIDAMRISP